MEEEKCFHNIFNISLTLGVKLHNHLVVRFIFFLNLTNLICQGIDIPMHFKKSLGLSGKQESTIAELFICGGWGGGGGREVLYVEL